MFFGNRMIHATYPALYERPEAFNGVGVAIAAHVNLFFVVDPLMVIARLSKKVIGAVLVSVNGRCWHNASDDMRHDRSALHVLNGHGNHFPAALYHPEDRLIVRV